MSDKSVTAANVLAGANAKKGKGTAGASITAGQSLYQDGSDSQKLKLADNNASAATANCVGIALHAASTGQPIEYVYEDDDFTPGFTVDLSAAGDKGAYALSATAGGICPVSDLASGNYPVYLMTGKSSTKVVLKIVRGTAALTA